MLRQSLSRIFPNEDIYNPPCFSQILSWFAIQILFKARKTLGIRSEDGTLLEVDASIPSLKFHVEYQVRRIKFCMHVKKAHIPQDPYHYTASTHYSSRPLADIQAVDGIISVMLKALFIEIGSFQKEKYCRKRRNSSPTSMLVGWNRWKPRCNH